uniref:Triple gene block protein 2 n=1 Tax=Blackberry calico virus TaxID=3069585 RepID=A0AA50DJ23_9VIRU|nr:triple gene block protein 2 [Blackberry calico virus]
MSFAPPPDFTRVYLAAAVGIAFAVVAHTLTRDQTPHVGDNIHHLPHGGLYQDGNKRILYAGSHFTSHSSQSTHWPALFVALLCTAILISERCLRRRNTHCAHGL